MQKIENYTKIPFNRDIFFYPSEKIDFEIKNRKHITFISDMIMDLGIRSSCLNLTPNCIIDEHYFDRGIKVELIAVYSDFLVHEQEYAENLTKQALAKKEYGKAFFYKDSVLNGIWSLRTVYPRFESEMLPENYQFRADGFFVRHSISEFKPYSRWLMKK